MKWIPVIARVLMGFVFAASGVTFFLMTPPELPDGPMKTFFDGMVATGYMFTLVKVTEIVCGLLLVTGFFVPLALVILAPVILNIFFVHLMLAPEGLWIAIILGAIEIYLAFFSPYSAKIKTLFQAKG